MKTQLQELTPSHAELMASVTRSYDNISANLEDLRQFVHGSVLEIKAGRIRRANRQERLAWWDLGLIAAALALTMALYFGLG